MNTTREYLDQYQELPRAAKWGILAALFLIVFLVWAQLLRPTARSWTEQANSIESDLARLQSSTDVPDDIRAQAIGFGTVQLPDRKQQGSLLLTQHVQQILGDHGITDDAFTMSRPTPLSGSTAAGLTSGSEKLERLKTDVEFRALPEIAIEIIAAMESDPTIESVASVKMDRDQERKIRVRLTIESWVRVKKRGGRS